jgi:carbon-monoxide dehydrogenase catalytic subunit
MHFLYREEENMSTSHHHGFNPKNEAEYLKGHEHAPGDHSHRPIIRFDKNGIPKVVDHEHDHTTDADYQDDYMQAVAAYKKTFPDKKQQMEETPDPAIRELMRRMDDLGIDNVFDRFDAQKPQCSFGIAGICCKNCQMGPCRITPKSPKGVCGADADLIVARNLCRMAAAGVAQHGMHEREVILNLMWAAEGKLDVPIEGEYKIRATAEQFGIKTKNRQLKNITIDLCKVLLDDLSTPYPGQYKTIAACAPPERQKVWQDLDIIPVSAYHETFESNHITGVGVNGDWQSVMQQMLRNGLAFTFSTVLGTSIATDGLLGIGDRATAKVNVGALKKDYVNIAVHGHLPMLVREIVRTGQTQKFIDKAKAAGAKGIQFYGICCSGLSAMYRYDGVIPLSNAISAEMVITTGALDLWVADVQEVYPAIMDVARCFKTTVVTTHDSGRLPGAEHIGYDHHHTNIGETKQIAEKIVNRAIESFENRKDVPVSIPPYEITADVGFSVEYFKKAFGGLDVLIDALKDGTIRGIINLVGCTNPRVVYEKTIVDYTNVMLKHNYLILTNGCASYPLIKLGYAQTTDAAWDHCGDSLKGWLKAHNLPPVLHVGECIDNARSTAFFGGIAGALGIAIKDMPYGFASPEWANEKGLDAALAFRLFGISSYHCVEAPIYGSEKVTAYMKYDSKKTLGSVMVVDADPKALGEKCVRDLEAKRKALGWD